MIERFVIKYLRRIQMVGIYSYEPNAFKFGDGPHSHSIINIPTRHSLQKNFNIQFDFRTFYPNGVLFVAPGTKEKPKHFIGLILRDGQLNLIVRGRRKEELNLPKQLNDEIKSPVHKIGGYLNMLCTHSML